MFRVDVITPVYNNQHFIRKCIESAHACPEVSKIIVVEDGSKDETLKTLEGLKKEFPKLQVVRHPGGVNRGIACSRNLGIQYSTSEWIAFLDSDDFYLANRFDVTQDVLSRDESADGVYEPVVNKILSMEGAMRFEQQSTKTLDGKIIRIKERIEPSKVFDAMYFGRGGVVHLDGLTIRRTLAVEIGLFDENLRIVDDSVFRLKAAYRGRLIAGSNAPVAVRTIHETNSEPNIRPYDNYMKHKVLLEYLILWKASAALKRSLIHRLLHHYLIYKGVNSGPERFFAAVVYVLSNPQLIFHYCV